VLKAIRGDAGDRPDPVPAADALDDRPRAAS